MVDDVSYEQMKVNAAKLYARIAELEARLAKAVPWDEHKKAIELAYFEGALRCGWEQSRALERLTERDAASQAETSAEGKS